MPPTTSGTPTSYLVQAGSAAGLSDLANANTGSVLPALTVTNVPPGTYYVRVLAQNAAGTSPSSNEIVVSILGSCSTPPSSPTNLFATVASAVVTLSWQPPMTGCAPTGYVIQAGTAPGLSNLANFSTGSNVPTFTATTVAAGTYYVRVLGINQGGASGSSNEIQLIVGPCTRVPNAPSGLTALVSGLTVTLSWTAASVLPASYIIDIGSSAGSADLGVINNGSATSFTAMNVPAGTYYVQVQATNACGTSPASNAITVVVSIPSGTFTLLHSFAGPDGQSPTAALVQGLDGNFYGTTSTGGSVPTGGTTFRMTPAGALTVLHNFAGGPNDGGDPNAALIQGTDGNFYGTTTLGGAAGIGAVFQMTPQGTVALLHAFNGTGDGGLPQAPLRQASDGNFYGTTEGTSRGNPNGTVFRLTPLGVTTVLYAFSGGADGSAPFTPVIQAADGNFYGTTNSGGGASRGTVFKLTPGGNFALVYTFTGGADGSAPQAVVQGADGNFYGTAGSGGAFDCGTVFKLSADGRFTLLHAFTGGDGKFPSGLVQATNGNFYGTTSGEPGIGIPGTVFTITPAGVFTVLHYFSGGNTDGAQPEASLIQGSDGNLYGTTTRGGALGLGTVFRLVP